MVLKQNAHNILYLLKLDGDNYRYFTNVEEQYDMSQSHNFKKMLTFLYGRFWNAIQFVRIIIKE